MKMRNKWEETGVICDQTGRNVVNMINTLKSQRKTIINTETGKKEKQKNKVTVGQRKATMDNMDD